MLRFLSKEHQKKYGGFNPDDTMTIFQDMSNKRLSNNMTMDLSAIDVDRSLFDDQNDFDPNKKLIAGFGQKK